MLFREMMTQIETGQEFCAKWVACDKTRNKGGDIRTMEGLRLLVQEQESSYKKSVHKAKPRYKYEESRQWINLWHEQSGRHVRLYKRLIIEFNGKTVEY